MISDGQRQRIERMQIGQRQPFGAGGVDGWWACIRHPAPDLWVVEAAWETMASMASDPSSHLCTCPWSAGGGSGEAEHHHVGRCYGTAADACGAAEFVVEQLRAKKPATLPGTGAKGPQAILWDCQGKRSAGPRGAEIAAGYAEQPA